MCHLVIVDGTHQHLAVSLLGQTWLLPFVRAAQPVTCASLAIRQFGSPDACATAIHCAPLPSSEDLDAVQYYCVAESHGLKLPDRLTWQAVDATAGTRAMVAEQHRAVETALTRVGAPEAPFDSIRGVRALQQWIDERLSCRGELHIPVSWRRRARFDAVGMCQTVVGRAYVKAGPSRFEEALLTERLRSFHPRTFSETVALDHDRQWWIGDELPGQVLKSPDDAKAALLRAVQTVAVIEQQVVDDGATAQLLSHRRIDADSLAEMLSLVWKIMDLDREPVPLAVRDLVEDRVLAACDDLARLQAPFTWVHSDFSIGNIVVNDNESSLIDLEYGCWSLPPLTLWRLLRETADAPAVQTTIVDTWLKAWARVIDEDRHHIVLNHLPILGRLLRLRILTERLCCQDGTPDHLVPSMYLQIWRPTVEGLVQAARQQQVFARG